MTAAEIRELVVSRIPSRYEHLKLTFHGRQSRLNGDHMIIGDDDGTDLCVNLSDGAIYSIDRQQELPTRFMNSGIEQLAQFIELSETFSGTAVESEILSRQMREALTKIDPKAFSDPENWWAIVLEAMAYGL
jgi:SUKH-4 immunity protein